MLPQNVNRFFYFRLGFSRHVESQKRIWFHLRQCVHILSLTDSVDYGTSLFSVSFEIFHDTKKVLFLKHNQPDLPWTQEVPKKDVCSNLYS